MNPALSNDCPKLQGRKFKMNSTIYPVSTKEMLRQAFQDYQDNPETVVPIADQILCAAMQTPKLKFTPTSSGRLNILIGDAEEIEVRLPGERVSSFRSLLARFGVICGATAQKRSLAGKSKTVLYKFGSVSDKTVTEPRDGVIEYVSAVVREQPGSPLYKVDATLEVKLPNGKVTSLHLEMQNELQKAFLLIEFRGS